MKHPCIINTMGMSDSEIESNIKLGNWERCEYCKTVFDWGMLPDENVIKDRQPSEFQGATVYETIIMGYVCPECGYKVSF